jgi:hypothetical protein
VKYQLIFIVANRHAISEVKLRCLLLKNKSVMELLHANFCSGLLSPDKVEDRLKSF